MIDAIRLRILLVALSGWVNRHQHDIIDYLREENRVLKEHLSGQRLRLTDRQRRRLAATGHRVGRRALAHVATLVTPDTILRWHRQLIARKWTAHRRRVGRPGVLREIGQLAVRMAQENPTWGYRRIQGALKNLGHRVARSTIADILCTHGIGPVPKRPMSWRTFLAAHWSAIAAADFFTTEVWTVRGLVTYYTLFVIELASRRVHLVGSAPHPDDAFMCQVARVLTSADLTAFSVATGSSSAIRTQNGARHSAGPWPTVASASYGRRFRHPTAMPTRSDSSGRSRRSV
jgi:putative transposase